MLHRLKTEGYKLQANVLIFLDYDEMKLKPLLMTQIPLPLFIYWWL